MNATVTKLCKEMTTEDECANGSAGRVWTDTPMPTNLNWLQRTDEVGHMPYMEPIVALLISVAASHVPVVRCAVLEIGPRFLFVEIVRQVMRECRAKHWWHRMAPAQVKRQFVRRFHGLPADARLMYTFCPLLSCAHGFPYASWNPIGYSQKPSCYSLQKTKNELHLLYQEFRGVRSIENILPRFHIPRHGGNSIVPPENWGMTVLQLLQFCEACQCTTEWGQLFILGCEFKGHFTDSEFCVNGYEVCTSFVKPWTRGTGCSVSLLMNETPRQAELMLSHGARACNVPSCRLILVEGWGEDIEQVYNMLKHDSSLSDATSVWFCIFAVEAVYF